MIGKTAEYALRAIVYLSEKYNDPCTTQQIAQVAQVPAPYLSKVMRNLRRVGLVHAQRGLNGGFTLSKTPSEITVLEVIEAVEPLQRIRKCPLGLKQHETELCPLHRRLDDAAALMEASFRATRIADLLTRPILVGVD